MRSRGAHANNSTGVFFKQVKCCMDSAGAFLKAERLKQNKTLKDIAEGTKVGIFTLDALESDKTELLPPEAYVRGFIKAYANELDINPDEVLAMHAAHVQAAPAAEQPKEVKHAFPPSLIPGYAVPVIAGAVVLLVCALFFGYKGRLSLPTVTNSGNDADVPALVQPREPEASSEDQDIVPASKPAAAQPAGTDNASASAATNPFTIRFAATERCWMRFTVDGKHVFEVILKQGETYSVNAVSDIKVRIGNPGGVTAFYNNIPVAITGRRGRPVEMSFPPSAHTLPVSSH
jgi:cytoskeletal protein RodZ